MNSIPVPIKNLKNTCYINCSLQLLSLCQPLILLLENLPKISNIESPSNLDKILINEFKSLFQYLNSSNPASLVPTDFIELSSAAFPKFPPRSQQDIVEYIQTLLNLFISYNPKIENIFKCKIKSTISCRTCKNTRICNDFIYDLGIPIPNKPNFCNFQFFTLNSYDEPKKLTLDDCINEYFDKKINEFIECGKCGKETDHFIENHLDECGDYVVMFLKRYKNRKFFSKDSSQIRLSQVVNISTGENKGKFLLVAVVEHTQFLWFGGHYTCYVKRGLSWYFINDEIVKPCKWEEVANSQAYVMLFKTIRQ